MFASMIAVCKHIHPHTHSNSASNLCSETSSGRQITRADPYLDYRTMELREHHNNNNTPAPIVLNHDIATMQNKKPNLLELLLKLTLKKQSKNKFSQKNHKLSMYHR